MTILLEFTTEVSSIGVTLVQVQPSDVDTLEAAAQRLEKLAQYLRDCKEKPWDRVHDLIERCHGEGKLSRRARIEALTASNGKNAEELRDLAVQYGFSEELEELLPPEPQVDTERRFAGVA